MALNRCAKVRDTVSFSGLDFNVITGWSRQSRSTRAIWCRFTIDAMDVPEHFLIELVEAIAKP